MSKEPSNDNPDNSKVEEPDCVVVNDPYEGGMVELPTDPNDNTLELATLESAIFGCHGNQNYSLKYTNPITGASRALTLDQTGTRFKPPAGGWREKVFSVTLRDENTAADRKRMKTFLERLKSYVYYLVKTADETRFAEQTEEMVIRNCVTIVNEQYAVTAHHCLPQRHPCLHLANFTIFHLERDNKSYEVQVVFFNQNADYAWLKCISGKFTESPGIASPHPGGKVYAVGLPVPMYSGLAKTNVCPKTYGVVEQSIMQVDVKPSGRRDSFFSMIYPGLYGGFSGAGIFNTAGWLVGINVCGKDWPGSLYDDKAKHVLTYTNEPPYCYMVPAPVKLTTPAPSTTTSPSVSKRNKKEYSWMIYGCTVNARQFAALRNIEIDDITHVFDDNKEEAQQFIRDNMNLDLETDFLSHGYDLILFMFHVFSDCKVHNMRVECDFDQQNKVTNVTLHSTLVGGVKVKLTCGQSCQPTKIWYQEGKKIIQIGNAFGNSDSIYVSTLDNGEYVSHFAHQQWAKKNKIESGLGCIHGWIEKGFPLHYFTRADLEMVAKHAEEANQELKKKISEHKQKNPPAQSSTMSIINS
ncbi:trypsin-like peptidase domain-containing protein [Ditylenchus destructor]|uniref:Trypsin-like peptidase domain-containing protein n=1 Tax=Ditylenchus destructor TaxID=166010 RepID=A0AAD4MSS7_9BILA|nr:trypsin-like peptidase domain-containing protein [Ditylenchus destructor]